MGQVNAKGTVGTNLDVTIDLGNRLLYKMIINAPIVNDDATLIIYDTTTGTTIFSGYMANRDSEGAINFLGGEGTSSTTKFIVSVIGGSGDLFVNAIYE